MILDRSAKSEGLEERRSVGTAPHCVDHEVGVHLVLCTTGMLDHAYSGHPVGRRRELNEVVTAEHRHILDRL
jgi:hypothetical protein